MVKRKVPVAGIAAILAAIAAAAAAAAQETAPVQSARSTVVRIQVTDSAGQPIAGADLAVLRGLADVLARGTSDTSGRRTFVLAAVAGDVQVVARRLGYQRADQFQHLAPTSRSTASHRDTIDVSLQMIRVVPTLAAVKVTAEEDLKRKSYFVDADQIAASKRLILNGMDVLTKMRPDILTGRAPGCGVRDIYVNGERILYPSLDEVAIAHIPRAHRTVLLESIWSVMWSIKAEHVEQMLYKDCFDTSMPGTHASSALYIVLKPGVAYEPGPGSYVVDSTRGPGTRRQ